MLVSNFPPEVAQTLQRVATDIVRMEQYMDFVRNRLFRQTLLVHQGAPIRRNLDGRVVKGLLLTSASEPESAKPVLAQGASETFQGPQRHEAQHCRCADQGRPSGAVVERGPLACRSKSSAAMSRARLEQEIGDSAESRTTTRNHSAIGCCRAMRRASWNCGWPRRGSPSRPSARPVASPLARLQARDHHHGDEPAPRAGRIARAAAPDDDAARRHPRLRRTGRGHREARAAKARSAVREQEGGPVVTDPARLEQILRMAVADNLPKLARVALLME